jgi:hypothetical protein
MPAASATAAAHANGMRLTGAKGMRLTVLVLCMC